MNWAKDIGKSVSDVVEIFLSVGDVPEQGYKSCISLMKLCLPPNENSSLCAYA